MQRPSLKYKETVKIAQQLDLTPELSSPNADHDVNLTRVQRENVSSSESTVVRQLRKAWRSSLKRERRTPVVVELVITADLTVLRTNVDNPSEEMIVEEMTLGNAGTRITVLCVVTLDILPVIVNIGTKPHNNDTRETTRG